MDKSCPTRAAPTATSGTWRLLLYAIVALISPQAPCLMLKQATALLFLDFGAIAFHPLV
jgi:hypothetical protein